MTSPTSPLDGRSQTELLQLSRDALRRAHALRGDTGSVPGLVQRLGLLSDLLGSLVGTLDATRDELWRRQRVGEVDAVGGVFAGDSVSALTTMDLWAERARGSAARAREAVDNAHVATGGLANASRPGTPGRRRMAGRPTGR